VIPALREHLRQMPVTGRDALLFPAAGDPTEHMRPATLAKVWYRAREKAGRSDLPFHGLRHTGATMAAQEGATLADLMNRLGHATVGSALAYQHAVSSRDKDIAERLSARAGRPAGTA
jgi:integrase